VRWRHRDRSLFLWLLVAAALLVLVVNPIARLLWVSLQGPHGLTLANVQPIAALPEIVELNIGHSLVARAVVVGLAAAVREMKAALAGAT